MKFTMIISTCGYVWGAAEGDTPVEACVALDKEVGAGNLKFREIDEGTARDGVDHYCVYEGGIPDDDTRAGDDQDFIEEIGRPPARSSRASRGATRHPTTIEAMSGLTFGFLAAAEAVIEPENPGAAREEATSAGDRRR